MSGSDPLAAPDLPADVTRGPGTRPNELLIVTGMSGAGRATTAKALEDMDWYVVDNLPPAMLAPLAELTLATAGPEPLSKVAVVMDVRGRGYFTELRSAMRTLSGIGLHVRLLFLDAADAVLVRRFESVRRPHPLQQNERILDGIARERELTEDLRGTADLVIDTSDLNVHQLSAKLHHLFSTETEQGVRLTVISFGFKYGIPVDADHVVDVRFLPNPFWIPDLRAHTGLEEPVSDYVLSQPGAMDFVDKYIAALEPVIAGYERENRPFVTIGVGCTGGKHRSVAITEALTERLVAAGARATAMHRDLGRE
ncbi:MAG: RNase adapter RapZ [Actinomycetales bacterium]